MSGGHLEAIAAVGKPPAYVTDGNRREQRPPKRERKIGYQPEDGESSPEYFLLHALIVNRTALLSSCMCEIVTVLAS
jgi:hypothetical protein